MNFWVLIQIYKQVILLTLIMQVSGVFIILLVDELYLIILEWDKGKDIRMIQKF